MPKLIWSDEARTALERIYDYIAQDSPEAALRIIQGIYGRTEGLQNFPRLGYLHRSHGQREVRVLLYGHYRIAYLLDGDSVVVTSVVHASRHFEGEAP